MGVDTRRKPPLPAPTESSTLPTSGDDAPGTDLATDISRVTDRTSFSIPEDGTPLTISTKRRDKLDKSKPSQTSLLIEYFEGGKGPNVTSRPSVRVKVTPSSAKRSKDSKDHIQITESAGARRPSYTRRISLGPHSKGESHIIDENTSLLSAGTESNLSGRPPVEIEVMHKDQFSELSGTSASRINHNLSEVSSMPTDSILEGNTVAIIPERNRSRSLTKDEVHTMDTLKTPSRRRSRSLSRERLAQKVAEKVRSEPRKTSGKHKSSKSRSRSVSKEHLLDTVSSPRRKSSRHHKSEELPSGESSLLTASQVSDGRSFRSGTSKSSYNNPKLLETVEDAIRRLILPELTALKAEQKTQQNKDKFERTRRDSESSISREESSRRVSGRASDPNVRKPKVVLNRDEHNPGLTLSGDSIKKKKSRYDEKCMSEETITRDGDGKSRRRSKDKDGHRIKDAATGALLGGLLTHAALKHHDSKESKSSLERRERRRKRSKSHSRSHSMSTSVTGTDEIFYRHDIPPMPMSSEITGSDLTRDSILSERTSTPTSEHRRAEIRQVARGSPRQLYSPSRRTPEPSPLGQYHENDSRDELSVHSEGSIEKSKRKHHYGEAALAGGAAAAGLLAAKNARDKHYDDHEHLEYRDKRGLSPIQSVASFEEKVETSTRLPHAHSTGSLSSLDKRHSKAERSSMNSISSTGSGHIAHSSRRPKGFSLETGSEILSTRKKNHSNQDLARDPNRVSWYEGADDSDRYRDSSGGDSFRNSKIDVKHLTNYTDDSMDAPYLDKVTAAQQIRGIGANPEYIHTPEAVESAVASLYEPSMLDVRSLRSGHSGVGEGAYLDSPLSEGHHGETQYATGHIGTRSIDRGSPLKHYEGVDEDIKTVPGNVYGQPLVSNSPRQSVASEKVKMSASGIPDLDNPMPEIGHGLEDTRSEISTNPSYINGPGPMDTQNSLQQAAKNMLLAAAAGAAAGAGAGALANRKQKSLTLSEREVSRDPQNHPAGLDEEYHSGDVTQTYDGPNDVYMTNKGVSANRLPHDTMYMAGKGVSANQLPKDEGYITEDQMGQSGGALTPDHRKGHAGIFGADDVYNDDLPAEDPLDNIMGAGALGTFGMPMDDDPFIGGHSRHVSGGSHGMGSPLYDSATGKGMDRIQSQDVIALMDHLTVRDAQRNARDTEILVTLVRTAAEMRNSFEDMKKLVLDQDDMLVAVGNKQHEKTQRVLGGPRPQPRGAPRTSRTNSAEDMAEPAPAKRRNLFRRALGLGDKAEINKVDFARIEDMFYQLLDTVEELKRTQDTGSATPRATQSPYQNTGNTHYDEYEQEAIAGGASPGGYFSRGANRSSGYGRRNSDNRISTVHEADENSDVPLEPHEEEVLDYENTERLLTPTQERPRGGSVPLHTPPTMPAATAGTQSHENTPRTEKSKKHKTSSSSFFPKISRWSKTTASSMTDNFRGSSKKERPFSGISQSGSDLPNYEINDHYDPHGDDRLRSSTSLNDRPPSPLIPSQVSEPAAYHAHRNSLNLQHPQPRQGPTARYQNHLENQAQAQIQQAMSPVSPTSSDQFGSNPVLARFAHGAGNRNSGGAGDLSPIQSELSTNNAPARPPKIRDEGPLIPDKVPLDSKRPSYADRSAPAMEYASANGMVRGSVPQRKPTGPRPITTSGSYSPDKLAHLPKTRYRGSPNHIESEEEDETF